MKENIWCGIDPGKKGAIAFVDDFGNYEVYRTPMDKKEYDIREMQRLLNMYNIRGLAYEKVSAMPGQGVSSMFSFGMGYGIWFTLIEISKIKYSLVAPATWTKTMTRGAKGLTAKERAYHEARRLFPDWNPKTKVDQEQCDALLLAEYSRLVMK